MDEDIKDLKFSYGSMCCSNRFVIRYGGTEPSIVVVDMSLSPSLRSHLEREWIVSEAVENIYC